MKKLIIGTLSVLTALAVFGVHRYDRNLGLICDPNPASDNVTHYKFFVGTASRSYSNVYTSTVNSITLTTNQFFHGVTNYFAVSAVNAYGLESALSDEINELIITPPAKPINLRKQ